MARPKNADGQRTRQAVLDAALALFAEKGYFGTSLRDVAAAVGVRESALYNYFRNKEALFDALLTAHQNEKEERLAKWDNLGPITDAAAVLETLVISSLERFTDPREQQLFRLLMSDGIRLHKTGRFNLHERLGHGRERMIALMRRLMDDGWIRKADPNIVWMTFVGPLLLWRHMHAAGGDHAVIRSPRAFARQHVDQFMSGAAARSSTRPTTARPRRRAIAATRRKTAPRQSS